MKAKLNLLVMSATALALTVWTARAQVFNPIEVLKNRAVAASPRAMEEFPWLARSAAMRSTKMSATTVTKNRALRSSPRIVEEFPELARPPGSLKSTNNRVVLSVIKNRAWAASPRAREEFPWLNRAIPTTFKKIKSSEPNISSVGDLDQCRRAISIFD